MWLNLAINYGGRAEMVDAVRAIGRQRRKPANLSPADIDEATIAEHLYTAGAPDPDLLIRTAGEMRISNFLLWQISYAEIWVTEKCWPEFDEATLHEAIRAYAARQRRFGVGELSRTSRQMDSRRCVASRHLAFLEVCCPFEKAPIKFRFRPAPPSFRDRRGASLAVPAASWPGCEWRGGRVLRAVGADGERADGDAAGHLHHGEEASRPPRALLCIGTPSTGSSVWAATTPGKWAAKPAAAMITSRPALLGSGYILGH